MTLARWTMRKAISIHNTLQIYKYKLLGSTFGENIKVYGRFYVVGYHEKLVVGNNVTINEGVFFSCGEKIDIGDNVHLSPASQFHTGILLAHESPRNSHVFKPIKIGNNVWIASGVIVGCGVSIGNNSIIGAGSVVLENVDADCFYAGTPAVKIKGLRDEEKKKRRS